MKAKFLTVKQEAFCQAYVKLGDKSKAYREAYSTANMKIETVNKRASELYYNGEVTGRIEFLQEEIEERNNIEIDEIIKGLAKIFRFDIAELYNKNGALKDIKNMSITARQMISQLDIFEVYNKKGELQGVTKKIRFVSKLEAIEKLMKHLGAYERDNKPKPLEEKAQPYLDLSKLSQATLEEMERAYVFPPT